MFGWPVDPPGTIQLEIYTQRGGHQHYKKMYCQCINNQCYTFWHTSLIIYLIIILPYTSWFEILLFHYKAMTNKCLGSHQKNIEKYWGRAIFFFSSFWGKLTNKCLGFHKKKLKNDKGEWKDLIIRNMHAFHRFPKTEYLMRSSFLLL